MVSDIVACDSLVGDGHWIRLYSWSGAAVVAEAETGALDDWRVRRDSRIAAVHADIGFFERDAVHHGVACAHSESADICQE